MNKTYSAVQLLTEAGFTRKTSTETMAGTLEIWTKNDLNVMMFSDEQWTMAQFADLLIGSSNDVINVYGMEYRDQNNNLVGLGFGIEV